MITDMYGNEVKDGDTIKTSRGVTLLVEEIDEVLYIINTGNMQKAKLEKLTVDFSVIEG